MLTIMRLPPTASMTDYRASPTRRTETGQPLQVAILGHAVLAQRPSLWDNRKHLGGAKARSSYPAKDCSLGTFAPSYQNLLKEKKIAFRILPFDDWPVNDH